MGHPLIEALHETTSNLVVLLVPVHVAGALVSSLLERQNLVLSMITGNKRWPPPGAEADDARPRPAAALVDC
ncbi:MAG: hypothetical protein NZ555_01090 [Geminicoccaceae bacterium]|nr:hypothetical protein [Geminicoccaceae bacterium]